MVTAFSLANPKARIGHHHHVRAQLYRARRLKVPAISLLRDPIDCALSRASSWGTPERAELVLAQWWDFFDDDALINYSLLVRFETMTSSMQSVLEELNRKFGTDFVTRPPRREDVFGEMDRRRSEHRGAVADNPNRPDKRRAKAPASWRPMIAELPRAAEAQSRHQALTEMAL